MCNWFEEVLKLHVSPSLYLHQSSVVVEYIVLAFNYLSMNVLALLTDWIATSTALRLFTFG